LFLKQRAALSETSQAGSSSLLTRLSPVLPLLVLIF
jgi:hypothetical protein